MDSEVPLALQETPSMLEFLSKALLRGRFPTDQELVEHVQQLIDAGTSGNVNAKRADGNTALHLAVLGANDLGCSGQAVHILLNAGAKVNSTNNLKQTAAHLAASSVALEIFMDNQSKTASRSADLSTGPPPNMLDALINAGADLTAEDCSDCTPLHGAAVRDHLCVCKLLVSAGAKINRDGSRTCGKVTVLECAVKKACKDGLGHFPLQFDCCSGLKLVEFLLEKGADVNAGNQMPLAIATTPLLEGHVEPLVRLLVSYKADVHTATDGGNTTPLIACVLNGWVDAVRCIIDAGVDLHAQNQEGKSAIEFAARYGNLISVVDLVKGGGDGRSAMRWLKNLRDRRSGPPWISIIPAAICKIQNILDERSVAVCMGFHTRLGFDSQLLILDDGVLKMVMDHLLDVECWADWESSSCDASEWT